MIDVIARGLLVIGLALLMGSAAYAFSKSQQPVYQANMQFGYGRTIDPAFQLLGPNFSEPVMDEGVRIATAASEVDSHDVAVNTAKHYPKLKLNANQIDAAVDARPKRGTLVVQLISRAGSPQRAAEIASAYGHEFMRMKRRQDRRQARRIAKTLSQRLHALPPQQQKSSVRGAALRDQISAVSVLARVGTGSPQILQEARASSVPAKPQTKRNVAFGIFFGLAVGVGLVALRSETRTRARIAAARAMGVGRQPAGGR